MQYGHVFAANQPKPVRERTSISLSTTAIASLEKRNTLSRPCVRPSYNSKHNKHCCGINRYLFIQCLGCASYSLFQARLCKVCMRNIAFSCLFFLQHIYYDAHAFIEVQYSVYVLSPATCCQLKAVSLFHSQTLTSLVLIYSKFPSFFIGLRILPNLND
jgi:hypothetical protein